MDYRQFNSIVIEHRDSIIIIGIIILICIIICTLFIEFYVRYKLDCPYFEIGKFKFSPTLLMLIPFILVITYFPIRVSLCNYDVNNLSYETYIGEVEYSESSIKLIDANISIFVGKGHEIVPQGNHYGMVIYSTKSHVVVLYEPRSK